MTTPPLGQGPGFGVWGLSFGFGVWGLGFGVWGLGVMVRGAPGHVAENQTEVALLVVGVPV